MNTSNPEFVGYLHGSPITQRDIDRRAAYYKEKAGEAAAKTRAAYTSIGAHDMPPNHLPAGVSDPTDWSRLEWLDSIEAQDFTGRGLPLQYAPKGVQEARKRMGELHVKLTAIDETAEVLCEEYHAQGADVKAAMVTAAKEGKDPGDKSKAIEAKRVATATKYKDACLKRNAFLEALEDTYREVEDETRKGLPAWHNSILKARQKRTAQVAPVLTEAVKALLPAMSEALALAGHVQTARAGLGIEGGAPEPLADVAALSEALTALQGTPSLWERLVTDPVLSMDAAQYEKAHEAPFDWKAHESREATIEAFRQHYRVFGQEVLTPEQAAALVDGRTALTPFGHSI